MSDNDAFAVGLTCGGILDVFVEKVSQQTFPELADVAADIDAGRSVAIVTVVEHPDPERLGRRLIIRPAEDSPIMARSAARGPTQLSPTMLAASSRQARPSS